MTKVLNFFHIFLPKFQIQVINSKLTSGKNPLDIFVNNTAKRDTLFTSKLKIKPGSLHTLPETKRIKKSDDHTLLQN